MLPSTRRRRMPQLVSSLLSVLWQELWLFVTRPQLESSRSSEGWTARSKRVITRYVWISACSTVFWCISHIFFSFTYAQKKLKPLNSNKGCLQPILVATHLSSGLEMSIYLARSPEATGLLRYFRRVLVICFMVDSSSTKPLCSKLKYHLRTIFIVRSFAIDMVIPWCSSKYWEK